jgi:hypothetical protein
MHLVVVRQVLLVSGSGQGDEEFSAAEVVALIVLLDYRSIGEQRNEGVLEVEAFGRVVSQQIHEVSPIARWE